LKRHMIHIGLAIGLVEATFSTAIDAQNACTALLGFGIYDQYNTAATSTDFRLAQAWMCNSNFSSYDDVSKAGGAIGVDVGVLIGASADSSKEVKEMRWHQFCATSYDRQSTSASLQLAVRSVSPTLMSVVRHCLDVQAFGFAAWIATSADRKTFTYFARYRPLGTEQAKIRSFEISPRSIATKCKAEFPQNIRLFEAGKKIGNPTVPLTCSLDDPKTTVTVTIAVDKASTDDSNFARTLEGVEPVPTHFEEDYTVDAAGYSIAHQWLSTGLILPSATTLKITAAGSACLVASDPTSCAGPAGLPNAHPACAEAGIVCGALYGRIGTDGPKFLIGPTLTVTTAAGNPGVLFLGYGDIDYLNNRGSFTVHVSADIPPANNSLRRRLILNANR
jgi:hypothetical protein